MSDWRARVPAPVVACADAFGEGLRDAYGDDMVALWFSGAICFPGSEDSISDVDFHAVVARPFGPTEVEAHEKLHARMRADHGWLGEELDGFYVLAEHARLPEQPVSQVRPDVVDDAWALHRAHWHAGRVIVWHGPHPAALVPVPRWEEIVPELRDMIENAAHWAERGAGAYATLNACRVLWSFETLDPVRSKKAAGAWALDALPAEWHPLVRAALERYRDGHTGPEPALVSERAPAFVAWARERAR